MRKANFYNDLDQLNRIESMIGNKSIKKDDLSTLIRCISEGNERAQLIYGFYLLIECKDELSALEWIKIKKSFRK